MWVLVGIATIDFHCLEYALVPRQKHVIKLSRLHSFKSLGHRRDQDVDVFLVLQLTQKRLDLLEKIQM